METGVIFHNPLPSVQSLQALFPGLCSISDREILCIYTRGSASASIDRVYARARSMDSGKTWIDEGILWDKGKDDRLYSYGYGYPSVLETGEILLTGYRWDRSKSDNDFNIYNPVTLGAVPLQVLLFRSNNGGCTWTPPQVIPPPKGIAMANPSGRIVPLRNGRLLMPIETWKSWDDSEPVMQRSMALFSSDGGSRWEEHVTVACDPERRVLYWNGMFSRLLDGRILAMYWTKDSITGKDLNIHATWSEDEGQTWITPFDTGIVGQMGCSIDVGSGRVMAIYNQRDPDKPGIRAVISEDGGRIWPLDDHKLIWDARGWDIIGSSDPMNRSRSIYDEGLIAFGKPDVVRLADGTFLVGFWCTSNCVMHLRYCRLQLA